MTRLPRRGLDEVRPAKGFRQIGFLGRPIAAMPRSPGTINQWLYAFRQVVYDRAFSDWVFLPGGVDSFAGGGDQFAAPAINGAEAGNDGAGIEMLGVDFDQEPLATSGFVVIAIKNSPVFWFRSIPAINAPVGGGDPEPAFVFSIGNELDGTCAPPALTETSGDASSAAVLPLEITTTDKINLRLAPMLARDTKDRLELRLGSGLALVQNKVAAQRPTLRAYDSLGGQIVAATPVVVLLDKVEVNSEDDLTLAAGVATVVPPDRVVRLTGSITLGTTIAGAYEARAVFEVDDGSGFVELPGTVAVAGSG